MLPNKVALNLYDSVGPYDQSKQIFAFQNPNGFELSEIRVSLASVPSSYLVHTISVTRYFQGPYTLSAGRNDGIFVPVNYPHFESNYSTGAFSSTEVYAQPSWSGGSGNYDVVFSDTWVPQLDPASYIMKFSDPVYCTGDGFLLVSATGSSTPSYPINVSIKIYE